jgi:hypothetical protein
MPTPIWLLPGFPSTDIVSHSLNQLTELVPWSDLATVVEGTDWAAGIIPNIEPRTYTVYDDESKGSEEVSIFTASDAALDKQNFIGMFDRQRTFRDGSIRTGPMTIVMPWWAPHLPDVTIPGNTRPLYAPFSMYTPSALWPYTADDGSRLTVHDFGNQEIESDWMGMKPWVEVVSGRELDKIGALPAFNVWGDLVLGILPTLTVAILGFVAITTAPVILPAAAKIAFS